MSDECRCEPVSGYYGVLEVGFWSSYILDGQRLGEAEYMESHADDVFTSDTHHAFEGSYGSSSSIPAAAAALTRSMAASFPARDGKPAYLGIMQESWADQEGTMPANPWVELDIMGDSIPVGNYEIGFGGDAQFLLTVLSEAGSDSCVLAVGMGGYIEVPFSAIDATAPGSESIYLSSGGIPIYHPTDTPLGDISTELAAEGRQVCPIE